MLGQTGGGQVQVGGEFRIKGQDLVVLFNNHLKSNTHRY